MHTLPDTSGTGCIITLTRQHPQTASIWEVRLTDPWQTLAWFALPPVNVGGRQFSVTQHYP